MVGNIMYDSFLHFSNKPWTNPSIVDFKNENVYVPDEFYYMTCHRQENTSNDMPLTEILFAMNCLDAPTIYPVHPRNQSRALKICSENNFSNIILTQPVKYSDSVHRLKMPRKLRSSGGLQCEVLCGVQLCFVFDMS